MVRHDVAIVGEFAVAKRTLAVLGDDLPAEELPHLPIGTKFAVSPWVMRIFDSADTQPSRNLLLWDRFPPTARSRAVDWADLVATTSHGFLLVGVEISRFGPKW